LKKGGPPHPTPPFYLIRKFRDKRRRKGSQAVERGGGNVEGGDGESVRFFRARYCGDRKRKRIQEHHNGKRKPKREGLG